MTVVAPKMCLYRARHLILENLFRKDLELVEGDRAAIRPVMGQ
jgi:hypothetical protein